MKLKEFIKPFISTLVIDVYYGTECIFQQVSIESIFDHHQYHEVFDPVYDDEYHEDNYHMIGDLEVHLVGYIGTNLVIMLKEVV